jgi:hypothetical protein
VLRSENTLSGENKRKDMVAKSILRPCEFFRRLAMGGMFALRFL